MPGVIRSGALVVGESLVDITHAGDETSVHPGGSPLNVAVGLARLGVTTTLATQVGQDAYGDLIRTHLAASAVTLVELEPSRPSSVATARLAADGAAAYTFDLCWDPSPMALPSGCDLLHVGSLGATLAPGADTVAVLARDARRAGLTVSVDPNVRTALTSDLVDVRRRVLGLVAIADVVKLSDEDAAAMFAGRSHDGVLDDLFAAGGVGLVALTRGRKGALLATRAARVAVAAPRVALADTIGAGDSFMAALLTALYDVTGDVTGLGSDDLARIGTFACRVAAITCSRPGADPPWRAELATGTEPAETFRRSYPGPDRSDQEASR